MRKEGLDALVEAEHRLFLACFFAFRSGQGQKSARSRGRRYQPGAYFFLCMFQRFVYLTHLSSVDGNAKRLFSVLLEPGFFGAAGVLFHDQFGPVPMTAGPGGTSQALPGAGLFDRSDAWEGRY